MKNFLINFFELKESEITFKEVIKAGFSLFVGLGVVFLQLYL
ncbi:hypothetical protein [Desemzia sp. FAM 23989]